ncbi:acyl-CoA N-acyltransferase [Microdochium trichocladiopsis]|uniref:Acyl-CoA N-acyltransferase n=1 Tax=Microdochium trichocladiopsis TaxID=1682393 RepID=A0A9P8XVM6_9PEZI|nr:acyl-CoA N-acyltransferase [Microdochium trichocladiopsis]KAH7018171.1 acyl-CoA N-acyltransferase [Microdochium trichocladiopsis]
MTTLFPTTPLGPAVADLSPALAPSKQTRLQGKYVALEPLDTEKHAASLYRALSEEEASAWPGWAYLAAGPFASEAEFTQQIRAYSEGSGDPFFYAVITTPAGSAVGWISLLNVETAHKSVEVGHVAFSPVLQRTVESTEAFFLLIRHAFEALGNRRVEWKCDTLNAPSRRAAERLGMKPEGVFRKHRILRGRSRDTAWFSIVDDEWSGEAEDGKRQGLKASFEEWLRDDNFDENGRQKRSLEQVRADI